MKRALAVLAAAALVIGGGAVAYAATVGGDRAARAQAKACVEKARTEHADTDDDDARHDAVAACFRDAGVVPLGLGPVPRAVRGQIKALPEDKRVALMDCVKKARTEGSADRSAIREAVRSCLGQAGIEVPEPTPEQLARREKVKDCLDQARNEKPDAARSELREAVKACADAE